MVNKPTSGFTEGEAQLFVASEQVDHVARYVAAGREFEHLPSKTIRDTYLALLRALPVDPPPLDLLKTGMDLEAELHIRGEDQDPVLVAERAALNARMRVMAEGWMRSDPVRWAQMTESMNKKVQAALHPDGKGH